MTKREELNALADRCDRESASRELDVAIEGALGNIERWVKPEGFGASAGSSGGITYRGTSYTMTATWWGPDSRRRDPCDAADVVAVLSEHGAPIPFYTSSLDAAVTLVPEGLYREHDGPRPRTKIPDVAPNVWHCRITRFRPVYADFYGWAATEPAAVCAAALRARAADRLARAKTRSAPTEFCN